MEIQFPTGCGNSPRITIVNDFVTAWAGKDMKTLGAWLADDAIWQVIGKSDTTQFSEVVLEDDVTSLTIDTTITHGKLASSDGWAKTVHGRVDFNFVITFKNAVKASPIRSVKLFLVENA